MDGGTEFVVTSGPVCIHDPHLTRGSCYDRQLQRTYRLGLCVFGCVCCLFAVENVEYRCNKLNAPSSLDDKAMLLFPILDSCGKAAYCSCRHDHLSMVIKQLCGLGHHGETSRLKSLPGNSYCLRQNYTTLPVAVISSTVMMQEPSLV